MEIVSNKSVLSVDVITLRQFVGKIYIQQRQQDASEFLNDIISKIPQLEKLVSYSYNTLSICRHCNYNTNTVEHNNIMFISLKNKFKKSVTLQTIIDNHFSDTNIVKSYCDSCCKIQQELLKYKINSSGTILIVQLMLFSNNENQLKKLTKCHIKAVPRVPQTDIKINKNIYKVKSVIFYHGKNIDNGHYTCMLREERSWIYCNDNIITKKQWPRNGKDAYIFILQQQPLT